MALTFRTQQAGPLMQQGVFLAVFLSTAYTPQVLLHGWLADVARLNPVTHVLELGPPGDGARDRAELRAHLAGPARAGRDDRRARRARAVRAAADGPLATHGDGPWVPCPAAAHPGPGTKETAL